LILTQALPLQLSMWTNHGAGQQPLHDAQRHKP
jgi:hypothetical protein